MSKPIKEIGREMQAVSVSLDGQTMTLVPAHFKDTQAFPVYRVMTPEEHCELVREVWERAVKSRWWGETKYYFDETVEQFIESEKL